MSRWKRASELPNCSVMAALRDNPDFTFESCHPIIESQVKPLRKGVIPTSDDNHPLSKKSFGKRTKKKTRKNKTSRRERSGLEKVD